MKEATFEPIGVDALSANTFSFVALAQDAVATLYSSTGVVEVTLSKVCEQLREEKVCCFTKGI